MTEYLTVAEVSASLKISKYTVRDMIKGGKLPAIKLGKDWRFDPDDLSNYLKKRKTSIKN